MLKLAFSSSSYPLSLLIILPLLFTGRDGDGDSDSDTEEQRLLFEALQSRRAKESESKTDEATEFPTFIADDDDDDDHDDDDELKETLGEG